uniref:G-protein coupled receptors family 1 profile domain-containing protein n=1 Tax=Sus scrofa TaxID=9823 RepID=A0A8W4FME6_PIG
IGMSNLTRHSEFNLLGLSSRPEDQNPLFVLFLIMYLVSLMGNLLIVLAIRSNPQLQNPMYFFLSVLSFADICYTTVIVPKMLVNFVSETKTISYNECLAQMYFFLAFGNMDSYLLAAMAIDHYVAICNPFHYVTVMNHRRCVLLLAAFTSLTFCASNVIHHFFCDVNPILKLDWLASVMAPLGCIIISYLRILIAILKIPSAAGKCKAFSTCSSHLTVVTLFYGSISYVYFQPLSSYTVKDRIATVIYTVLTSMLNPFIFSLRNKDLKRGLEKLISRIKSHMDRLSMAKAKKICWP